MGLPGARPAPHRLVAALALATALVAGAAALPHPLPAPAAWHLLFAVGALPMILAAMAYFVPVLTRTGASPAALLAAPALALAAGLAIAGHFAGPLPSARTWAPWLALAAAGGFAAWMARRRRACIGHPNPCLAWYAAALGFLALGLAAVAASALRPEWAAPLRRFHMHANLLGFMGLTALGTLQVLLPTVVRLPDPDAPARLRRHLPPAAAGAALVSLGAAFWPPLAVAGALLYAWPWAVLLRTASRLLRQHGHRNALPLLAGALAGLGLVLGQGAVHGVGAGLAPPRASLPLFAIGFLLPLVSGALGQLLPVWLRPGVQSAWHERARRRLAAGATLRGLVLPLAGMAAALGFGDAPWLAALAALWLAVLAALTLADRDP